MVVNRLNSQPSPNGNRRDVHSADGVRKVQGSADDQRPQPAWLESIAAVSRSQVNERPATLLAAGVMVGVVLGWLVKRR